MRLYLFDIDGTLVNVGGAGRTAMAHAMEAVYGTSGAIDHYDFRGRTDPRIVLDLLGGAGWEEADVRARLDRCFTLYLRELDALLAADPGRVRVLPGVARLVEALGARDDAVVGLLTGNIEGGARVKLSPTGLWPRFRIGAFGSDEVDRRRLPAVARRRALALGHEIPFDRVTIIGDTPLDVDCARACGAVAVAVATGRYSGAELSTCAPDVLFTDLADVPAVLAAIAGA